MSQGLGSTASRCGSLASQAPPDVLRRAETAKKVAPAADTHMGAGKNVALMVVGGAALIIGAVIGGTAGVLIAVAGAAVGLYGLYNFVQ